MKRKQFTFYRSFLEAMRKLPEEMWLAYLVNIITYGLDGETTMKMNFTQEAMFELVKPNLEAAMKKAEVGAKGGRAFKASKQVSKGEKEKETESEKETEKETEIEVKKENEIESESKRIAAEALRESFERFWDLYPVKIGKDEAWAAWQRMQPDTEAVCQSVATWRKSRQWNQEQTRFVPRAAKFLEQEYYLQTPDGAQKGVYGHLGKAELEAIENIMREDFK